MVCPTIISGDKGTDHIEARTAASKIPDEFGRLPARNKLAREGNYTTTVGGEHIAKLCSYLNGCDYLS